MPNEDDKLEDEYEKAKSARIRARLFPTEEVCKRCGRALNKHEYGSSYHWAKTIGLY